MKTRDKVLTPIMERVLIEAYRNGYTQGGRYGHNSAVLRGMAKRGMLTMVEQGPVSSRWELTDAGRKEAEAYILTMVIASVCSDRTG